MTSSWDHKQSSGEPRCVAHRTGRPQQELDVGNKEETMRAAVFYCLLASLLAGVADARKKIRHMDISVGDKSAPSLPSAQTTAVYVQITS